MVKVKMAAEGDLESMAAFWLAPMKEYPDYVEQMQDCWRKAIQAPGRGVFAAYAGPTLQGFLIY